MYTTEGAYLWTKHMGDGEKKFKAGDGGKRTARGLIFRGPMVSFVLQRRQPGTTGMRQPQ